MATQTIDNYRLTSTEEPTDEVLAQLMHEAAEEAKQNLCTFVAIYRRHAKIPQSL